MHAATASIWQILGMLYPWPLSATVVLRISDCIAREPPGYGKKRAWRRAALGSNAAVRRASLDAGLRETGDDGHRVWTKGLCCLA
jgi:hypothetical protein